MQLPAKSLMGSTVRSQDGKDIGTDQSQLPQAPARQDEGGQKKQQ